MQLNIRPLVNNRSKNNLYAIKLQTRTVFYKRVEYPLNAVLEITYDYGILAYHILVRTLDLQIVDLAGVASR